MSQFNAAWILADDLASYGPLCAAARKVSNRVVAVWVGDEAGAQDVCACGADEVLAAAVGEGALFEDGVCAVVRAAGERKPDAVFACGGKRVRLATARIACALGTRVVNDVARLWEEGGEVLAERMVYGGKANSTELLAPGKTVALLTEGLLMGEQAAAGEAAATPLEVVAGESGLKLVEVRPRERESVNLAAARRVVSVGRGLSSADDLALIDELAAALDAEVGCTRPIAEGEGWMSRERYIGVSGAMLKPELFVAVGVSGQVQHMVGATSAKTIVAINKDKNAPVFKQADFGIVGDLHEVVPQLAAALKA